MSAPPPDLIPHQYPFRLVERLDRLEAGRCAIVLATANGALAGRQQWPVTLVAEALAQAILLVDSPARSADLRLVAMDKVALLQPLVAGDRLEVEIEVLAAFPPLRRYACRGRRDGALAAVAEITVSG